MPEVREREREGAARTQWITESIAFRAKLKSARRMRLREAGCGA